MLKVAICDDEAIMCNMLKEKVTAHLEKSCSLDILCYTDATELLKSKHKYDILLLDIQMPNINGIDFAKRLRKFGYECAIIFVTVLKENVFDAFEVEAIDYICKPVDDLRLKNALNRAIKHLRSKENFIFVQTMNCCKSVKLNSIYYCEVINRKIYLHTDSGVVEYYSKLKEIEKQLDFRFVKCHRSYIVNLDYLYEYRCGQITLENGDNIPVSRARQQLFVNLMLQYMKRGE